MEWDGKKKLAKKKQNHTTTCSLQNIKYSMNNVCFRPCNSQLESLLYRSATFKYPIDQSYDK